MRIRRNDTVVVLTGDDRGTRGRVLSVLPDEDKVIVQGVNRVYKHVQRSRRNPQGGRLSMEMPIEVSNVALFCENCNAGRKVGVRYLDDGSKERICRTCKKPIGNPSVIAPPRTPYASK